MIALDFKLTGAQVKALLRLYHEYPLDYKPGGMQAWPGLVLTESAMYTVVLETLVRKGLAETYRELRPGSTTPWDYHRLTESGLALVKLVVQQAHNILAIEASAKQMHTENAATRERWALEPVLPEPDLNVVIRRRDTGEVL